MDDKWAKVEGRMIKKSCVMAVYVDTGDFGVHDLWTVIVLSGGHTIATRMGKREVLTLLGIDHD